MEAMVVVLAVTGVKAVTVVGKEARERRAVKETVHKLHIRWETQ